MWVRIINSQQTEALLAVITRSQRPLRKLELVSVAGFANIDPGIVGRAINRLEEVTIVNVSVAQMTAILSILVNGESRLQKLRVVVGMGPADVRGLELDPDLVRRAKEKIGKFYF